MWRVVWRSRVRSSWLLEEEEEVVVAVEEEEGEKEGNGGGVGCVRRCGELELLG